MAKKIHAMQTRDGMMFRLWDDVQCAYVTKELCRAGLHAALLNEEMQELLAKFTDQALHRRVANARTLDSSLGWCREEKSETPHPRRLSIGVIRKSLNEAAWNLRNLAKLLPPKKPERHAAPAPNQELSIPAE